MKISYATAGTMPELPVLKGSEKQIRWAGQIRAALIKANRGNEGSQSFLSCLRIADCRFWIETRAMNFLQLGTVVSEMEAGCDLWDAIRKMRTAGL